VIYAMDESPVQKDVLWTGTNDGLVQVSIDGGKTWENVTKNIKGLPPLGTVRNIDASKYKAGKAYITVDFHQVGNFEPWVYKTEDFGKTWVKITDGIPKSNLSYACNIREDPKRPGLLYLGTENALYASFDDGLHWQSIMTDIPSSPMYWIAIQETFNDLVIGTYGRGIWILDDITPIQELTNEVTSSEAFLFSPRNTYRLRPLTTPYAMSDDQTIGENPPPGAPISFWLSADTPEKDSLAIAIKNASGSVVRTLYHKGGKAGVNRIWWNLREDPSTTMLIRNKPLHADWINLGDKRAIPAPGASQGFAPLVKPGDYTVTLTVKGKDYTKPIKVLKDPNSEGTEADVNAQYGLASEIKKDLNKAADIVNQSESIRRQAADLKENVKDNKDATKLIESLENQLLEIEGELLQLRVLPEGQSALRYPAQTVEKLMYLGNGVETADFRPTDQQQEVHQVLQKRLNDSQQKFNQLIDRDLPAIQEQLRKNNAGGPFIIKNTTRPN